MKEKTMKTVKILTITLLVILISMISFVGIYQKNKNKMENKVKDYSYSMSLNGARTIKLKVNTESTDDVPNNSEEVLTAENYKKSKEVIEKRLNKMNVEEYTTSVNETTGEITIQIPEQNSQTDTIIGNLNTVGKFEILDSETKEVLLNNDDIKSSEVLYNTTNSGTSVYLQIEFNKNGKDKLKNVSQTYVSVNNTTNNTTENNVAENTTSETENEATNTTTEGSSDTATTEKKITMKIDDQEIMSTSFDEPITTGKIQLSVGSASTDTTSSTFLIFFSRRISAPMTNAAAEIRNIIVPQNSDEPVSLSLTGFTTPSPTSNNVPTNNVIALDHRITLAYFLKTKAIANKITQRPILRNIICNILHSNYF